MWFPQFQCILTDNLRKVTVTNKTGYFYLQPEPNVSFSSRVSRLHQRLTVFHRSGGFHFSKGRIISVVNRYFVINRSPSRKPNPRQELKSQSRQKQQGTRENSPELKPEFTWWYRKCMRDMRRWKVVWKNSCMKLMALSYVRFLVILFIVLQIKFVVLLGLSLPTD